MEADARLGPALPAEDPEMTSIPWLPSESCLSPREAARKVARSTAQATACAHTPRQPGPPKEGTDPGATTFQRHVDLAVLSESLGSSDILVLVLRPLCKNQGIRISGHVHFKKFQVGGL